MERISDTEAIDRITRQLHGREWDAGDIEGVAETVRKTGRTIGPPRETCDVCDGTGWIEDEDDQSQGVTIAHPCGNCDGIGSWSK